MDKHLDADEAIVLGAALHAANLSDGIKLNRKLGMIDGSTYGYVMKLDGVGLVENESTKQVLVPRMKKVPSKVIYIAPELIGNDCKHRMSSLIVYILFICLFRLLL